MTRGQKAAATRRANAATRAKEARRREYQDRAAKAWQTRRENLKAKGLLDVNGNPTRKLRRIRKETAAKVWETRRANERKARRPARRDSPVENRV